MNIPDKRHLVGEQRRVLRRGGRLVFGEVFAGPGGEAVFPTPWASDPSTSFLVAARRGAQASCSRPGSRSGSGCRRPHGTPAADATPPRLPAVSIVHGADEEAMNASTLRNGAEQRVTYARGVWVRR